MKREILFITTLVFIFFLTLTGQQQTSDGGFIICGTTESYANVGSNLLVYKLDPAGNKLWRKYYGAAMNDFASEIIQTSDGGYALCGYGRSYTHGMEDYLLYKLDGAGTKQWRKNYGGGSAERGLSIVQTSDGGYAFLGYSGIADAMFLMYKLKSDGSKSWRRSYGGNDVDVGRAVRQIPSSGYVLAGYSYSYTHGSVDFLVYKVSGSGDGLWRKNFGGVHADNGMDVRCTADGGFLVSGYGSNYSNGGCDLLVYKLDAAGRKMWRKNYGGIRCEHGGYLCVTADGGFALCGETQSYTNGSLDFLVYKLDATGQKQWRRNFGGADMEGGGCVGQTSDGGYFVMGYTESYTHGIGDRDLLIYRLDPTGAKLWRKNYGGQYDEWTFR